MLSDLGCNALPFDIPTSTTPYPQEDPLVPLNFDDLLDIAREFEFMRTITHIWPCEEEPSPSETRLDDILAAIASTPNTEECPIPSPGSISLAMVDPVRVSECPGSEGGAHTSRDLVPLPKDDDHVQAKMRVPITSILRGWSPSNGSEFLDLDDNLMFPQPVKDTPNPLLPASLPVSSLQQTGDVNQSFAAASALGDVQPQTSTAVPKYRPTSTTDKISNDAKKNAPTPRRNILETVQAQSAMQPVLKATNQPAVSQAKTPKPRSTPAVYGTSSANHARAPRGGIPPHIARSVTRVNILRIEKERKVVQDAVSVTAMGQGKKPSVLRKPSMVEIETSESVNCSGSGREPFDWDENGNKQRRTAKRVRI